MNTRVSLIQALSKVQSYDEKKAGRKSDASVTAYLGHSYIRHALSTTALPIDID